eukprot:scaffold1610_cov257-Pinguiococcus_pyrenoidosus.AAC.54
MLCRLGLPRAHELVQHSPPLPHHHQRILGSFLDHLPNEPVALVGTDARHPKSGPQRLRATGRPLAPPGRHPPRQPLSQEALARAGL